MALGGFFLLIDLQKSIEECFLVIFFKNMHIYYKNGGFILEEIIDLFPNDIIQEIIKYKTSFEYIEEIRLGNNNPVILKFSQKEIVTNCIVKKDNLKEIFNKICKYSIYAYQNEIINGFITIKGGHRVGITGQAVIENGKIVNMKYISSLNFRISHNVKNCSDFLLKYILNIEKNEIFNTLIVSSPGAGKTTILKDLVKKISDGIKEYNFLGQDICVIDERGEISSMYEGICNNDLGIRTDVILNITKPEGIKMAIRSMAPKVIVSDEIGNMR